MPKYTPHSLQLNDDEEAKFQRVKKQTGYGIKKIFMAMVDALDVQPPVVTIEED